MERDHIGECLRDAERRLWEVFGLLNAAQTEAHREGLHATEMRSASTLTALAKLLDEEMGTAIHSHDHEMNAKGAR